MASFGTISDEDAAFMADVYIEALLASGEPAAGEHADMTAGLDPELVHAADVLTSGLVRFHPSFRFEERLATRLREASGASPYDAPSATPHPLVALPAAAALPAGTDLGRAVERVPLAVLVGGAIASGVSLAGAAFVAWRRTRRLG